MPRDNNDDDDGDSCVLIGTPLADLLPEDVKFSTKPKRQEEQIVTDERGKQRFHGAFTGGFSAGYFNSVGTKEGWAPSTFKSTRADRTNKNKFQRPEDFMDDEDFNEHGIAPKQVKIKSDYKDEMRLSMNRPGEAGFGLDDMVKPTRNTIGVKMLKKMGWREGQGVGPKIKRKLRRMKKKISHDPGRKTYGVALPSGSEESEEADEFEDEFLVSNFDVNEFQFEIKEDVFGLGYKRLDVSNLFNQNNTSTAVQESPAASLLFPMIEGQKKGNKYAMSGQAFGTGDFDDDEDMYDIYKQDSKTNYNYDLGGQVHTDQKKLLDKTYGFGAFENDILILKKFIQSDRTQAAPKYFRPPEIPADFDFRHKLTGGTLQGSTRKEDSMDMYLKTASERGAVLGEEALKASSVMDLISPSDKQFLADQRNKKQRDLKQIADEASKEKKSKRYAEFITNSRKELKDPYGSLDTTDLTEWEKEQEREEFGKIYDQQTKRINEVKGNTSKFVSTKTLNEKNEEIACVVNKGGLSTASVHVEVRKLSDEEQAAADMNYGKLTRKEFEFRPHPILCKRFNTPNPYPNNILKEYGTVKDERTKLKSDKFSVFNFMTAGSRFDTSKTISIFDKLNENAPRVQGPSSSRVISLPSDLTSDNPAGQIEFESKTTAEKSDKKSIFNDSGNEKKNEPEKPNDQVQSNIYLQARPEIDLFKAIFEDSNDEEEEDEPVVEISDDDETDQVKETIPEVSQQTPEVTTVQSSIKNINMKDISRYLGSSNDNEKADEIKEDNNPEPGKIVFKKPGSKRIDEALVEEVKDTKIEDSSAKFTNLIRSLVNKTVESSESSSSEGSYEEVSISKSKKSHKKDKKKKKKKHKHKKKSNKSHK